MAYTGVYERTIFYNPVNKYSVISVKTSDRSIPEKARSAYRHRDNMIHFAAVGYELPRTDQVSMILDGEWKEGKNGVQRGRGLRRESPCRRAAPAAGAG